MVIESQLTVLGADRPYYRGRDALRLAETHEFEDVAHWLWTGGRAPREEWRARPRAGGTPPAAPAGLPPRPPPPARPAGVPPGPPPAAPPPPHPAPPARPAPGRPP